MLHIAGSFLCCCVAWGKTIVCFSFQEIICQQTHKKRIVGISIILFFFKQWRSWLDEGEGRGEATYFIQNTLLSLFLAVNIYLNLFSMYSPSLQGGPYARREFMQVSRHMAV